MIKKIITTIIRTLKPSSGYRLAPLSSRHGFDRGTPIDRYWIENFLDSNRKFITGRVLEITDNTYTKRFGHDVTKSDVLDINAKNTKANIIGDLRKLTNVKSNTYDTIILTHVLGLIDDLPAAVSEIYRVLVRGGTVLVTSSCLSPDHDHKAYWRFTPQGMRYLFDQKFNVEISSYGNALTGQAFWVGMAQEDLTSEQLIFNDSRYPVMVSALATKK